MTTFMNEQVEKKCSPLLYTHPICTASNNGTMQNQTNIIPMLIKDLRN